jgi:ribonucleoside-triphosphate reductase (thioredoxin)
MDQYQQYIHKSRYARYLDDEGRRETWDETVNRYIDFFAERGSIDQGQAFELFNAIRDMQVMPSMRCIMTAGAALKRDNVAAFNCSYLPIDSPRSFDELMYILMCGTGVGFSVERDYVNQLPVVADSFHDTKTTVVVSDSKVGWASAFRELISLLYAGKVPKCDLTKVRAAGARLKTFGGRASGPQPLADLFNFSVDLFKGAAGRKLTSLECHDLVCKIADIVVVGGVRRSALISLSNVTDNRMANAKNGEWYISNGQRALANNSAVYSEKPDFDTYSSEMKRLYDSKSGERGIFSRIAAQNVAARNERRDATYKFGTNPCSEIILRPYQFCNLSEVIVRTDDTLQTLKEKVRLATILGTLQATLTDFRYLRNIWKRNTEEEALLGVSMTGIMDCKLTNGSTGEEALGKLLDNLRTVAVETNRQWASALGINQSVAITCVKPSGTVSQLTDSASGIHPRFSDYYIRTVRADKKDPLATAMIDRGFPHEEDVMNNSNWVFSFPQKAPSKAVTVESMGAMEQLRLWKTYQDHWCEHKPSMTCYYNDDNFFAVCQWIWENFDSVSGISFLPEAEHVYKQAPYQKIDKETYQKLAKEMPKGMQWDIEESSDNTEGAQTLACVAGVCEI